MCELNLQVLHLQPMGGLFRTQLLFHAVQLMLQYAGCVGLPLLPGAKPGNLLRQMRVLGFQQLDLLVCFAVAELHGACQL